MAARDRWDRLVSAINATALPVALGSRTYPGGVTYYISRTLSNGNTIEIHDKWWRKNPDVWIGYEVHVEARDSIVRRTWPTTKKRSVVVAAVLEATRERPA